MDAPIRILHIFGKMDRGGAEMRTLDLMRHMDRDKIKLDFCTLSGEAGALDSDIRALGGEVYHIPLGPSFIWKFIALLRKSKYDIVHSHLSYFSALIILLAKFAAVQRRIVHFRNTFDGKKLSLVRKVRNFIFKNIINIYASDILAVSKAAMEYMWSSDWQKDKRCRVIYNGIDPNLFKANISVAEVRKEFGIDENNPLIIHVGNLRPAKNHNRLLDIFSIIASKHSDAKLILVGIGSSAKKTALEQRISELGLADSVLFCGERSDVPNLLKASDLMLFPSLWEGLPGVVLEACAAGLPVLASALPGIVEIAESNSQVNYLELSEDNEKWASAALSYLSNLSLEQRAKDASKFFDGPFVISRCVKEMEQLWCSGV